MFTADEIYDYCRERISYPLPAQPDDDRLHGVFAEMSREDIATLFDNIECGAQMLPRLLSAMSDDHPEIDPYETLDSFISAYRRVMDQFLAPPDCARWHALSVDHSLDVDDEDLLYTVYDTFGDWIAAGGPDLDHPVKMLREAMYSIKADYMVAHYITWPLNQLSRQLSIDPLEPLFALSVRGYTLIFQGDCVNIIQ
jgi:hypothetical protein